MELYQRRLLITFSRAMSMSVRSRGVAFIALALALLPANAQNTTEINLFFYGAKTKLYKKQVVRLDSLLNTVDRSQIIGITLVGHTDSIFGRASNLPLAEERALSVKKLLVERSVPDSLITCVPFSDPTRPREGLHPKGPTRNRRVYMRLECGPADVPPSAPIE